MRSVTILALAFDVVLYLQLAWNRLVGWSRTSNRKYHKDQSNNFWAMGWQCKSHFVYNYNRNLQALLKMYACLKMCLSFLYNFCSEQFLLQ